MSYKIYPVTHNGHECDDYVVRINGSEVELNTARVSAVPFNRRWPGHQRQIEQTETVQFLSLATDEPLTVEIAPKTPFENVKIRPKSLGISPNVENGKITFTLDKPAYFTVEPYGRSRALHIFADPMSEYNVDKASPDFLYFGTGEHDVGLLELKSNQTVFIDEGAVVYACIHAKDAENIKILGRGILDNSKNKERILFESNVENNSEAVNNEERIHTIQLEYCTNVDIDGITIRDSLVYNIRPIGCKNLNIRNVKIIGCWRFNSDGIDMHNCENVHISDCFIRTFDDSICIKGFDCYYDGDVEAAVRAAMYRGGKAYDVFKNVVVENCVIWNDWGKALEIGAETKAEEICDIVFRNCDLIHLTGPALDCMNVDYADVHDVTFKNINVECDESIPMPCIQSNDNEQYVNQRQDYMPDTVSISVVYHHEYSKGSDTRRGKNRDFLFENIRVFGDKCPRIVCIGYDKEHMTSNIRISNLYLNDEPVLALPEENWSIGDYTDNVMINFDEYSQMQKNSVSAAGQLKETMCVKFDRPEAIGTRVMFVGNSITLHGVKEDIGWFNAWGMAASKKENDYVHILERSVLSKDPEASFCVCQVAEWEMQYKNGSNLLSKYKEATEYEADIIILRFIENCPKDDFNAEAFKRELEILVNYLKSNNTVDVIVTTGFWNHPGNPTLREYARENNYPCIELGDLGEKDEMKAIGLFWHEGVANHPGDLGMKTMAERIEKELVKFVKSKVAPNG